MAVVSRLQLDHPALGTTGGAGLHASIQALYQKIGDNMADRLFFIQNLDDATSSTVEHNFKVAFGDLRYDLYLWDEGTGELTRLTSASSPTISAFTIAATSGFATTKIDVTNNSGAQRDLALVVLNDPIDIDELTDVDLSVAPQDGQALVYDAGASKFKAGASGDASFKLQSIAANVLTLKGGYLQLDDGRELATYSSPTYGVDITVSLLALEAAPADGTVYYLYIDLDSLGSEQSQGLTGRKLYQVTQANMVLSATTPAAINRARYVVLGSVMGEAASTYEVGNFTTIAARKHDNGPLAINPKVYSLSQAVGSVGSASQIKAGHILAAESFPSAMAASKVSFFNLVNASGTDGSANDRNLTPNGTPAGGANIFGTALAATALDGVDDNFSSNSADLNPANSQSFAVGGWFKATDWTPASQKSMLSQANSGDLSFEIANAPTGLVFRATNTAGSFDASMTIGHTFVDGSWNHVAMVYDFSLLTLKAYINGKLVGSANLINLRGASAPNLRVGSLNGGDFFLGAVQDVFVVKNHLLTDADIRKLYASKLTHGANVSAANQDWKFLLGSGVQKVPSISPVVDQTDSNTLYADFSDLDAAETVDIALLDMGMTAVAVPAVPPFDQTYTSNPSFPISHGLSEVPSLQVGYKDASGDWHWTTGEGAVKADSTQLKGSIQTYFDAAATHVRIRAVVGASPTGVKEATASAAGIVKGGTVPGKIDGVAVAAGYVGETLEALQGSPQAPAATGTYKNITSLLITKGVWEVTCDSYLDNAGMTSPSNVIAALSTTTASEAGSTFLKSRAFITPDTASGIFIGRMSTQLNLSSDTTYYLNGKAAYTGSPTQGWQGRIFAKRIG